MIFAVPQFDLEHALKRIEANGEPMLHRRLIPGEVDIPEELNTRHFTRVNPQYHWLFAFLTEIEEELGEQAKALNRVLNSNAIIVLMENAFGWGNKHDPSRPIDVTIYIGQKGVLIRLEDSGKGFNAEKVIHKYDDHDFGDMGEFENTGYGMRCLQQARFDIVYEHPANRVFLLDLFE